MGFGSLGGDGVGIRIVGDKELARTLDALVRSATPAIVGSAMRKSMRRVKKAVVAKASGPFFKHPTGNLVRGLKAAKPGGKTKRGQVRIWWLPPTREALGLDPTDKHYYPFAVEYGHGNVPPKSYIRSTVNEQADAELRQIGVDIGKGIERAAKKRR